MRLQYLAGMGVNADAQIEIYAELMKERRIPPDLFTGSAEALTKLREAIENNPMARPLPPPEIRASLQRAFLNGSQDAWPSEEKPQVSKN